VEVIELVRPMARRRDILLAATMDGHHVLADRQRLKQVLLNLVSNAVKYGRQAGNVTLSGVNTADGRLRISVRDDGPGIPADKLPRLFSPFDRLGAELSEIEGTGLGLTLSKTLVEAMGGRVGVDSAVGRGSTFWIELPIVEGSDEQLRQHGNEGLDAAGSAVAGDLKTVLCIEDNLSNLRLIEGILSRRPQVRLLAASLGQLGIDLAREHRPDLILLDQHLPDLNGYEVLRRLKEDSRTNEARVVMVTADASPGQIERFLAAGAQEYLTKPLNVKQFLQTLDQVLET
jgi:signal transduction histidine kinase